MSTNNYILGDDNKTPIVADLMTWAKWFEKSNRTVKKSRLNSDVLVSTVFLGLDHNMGGEGPPVLWETMIFGGEHDEYCDRYSSYKDAIDGHEKAVDLVKEL